MNTPISKLDFFHSMELEQFEKITIVCAKKDKAKALAWLTPEWKTEYVGPKPIPERSRFSTTKTLIVAWRPLLQL